MILSGLLAAPFYLVLIIFLGLLEPGYSHLTMPMSLLGGVPGIRGQIFNTGVGFTGVLVILFATAFWRQLPSTISARVAIGLFIIGGLGLVGAAVFHCNAGCKNVLVEPDLHGQLHAVTSLVAGMGTGLALFFFWAVMRISEAWKRFATPTVISAVFANVPGIIFWITFATDYKLESIQGLLQRLGFVVTLIWMFYLALKLMRTPLHNQG